MTSSSPGGTEMFKGKLTNDYGTDVYVDLENLPSPYTFTKSYSVLNQSVSTLYYKAELVEPPAGWSITSPTDGKLGSRASGARATWAVKFQRETLPETPVDETLNVCIRVFTNSTYTTEVGTMEEELTIRFVDISSWPELQVFDFDDGELNGWDGAIYDELSLHAGGKSCAREVIHSMDSMKSMTSTTDISCDVTLPDTNVVVFCMYVATRFVPDYPNEDSSGNVSNAKIMVTCDGTTKTVFSYPGTYMSFISKTKVADGWLKFVADLSEYRGKTINLKFSTSVFTKNDEQYNRTCRVYVHLDDVRIAGTG
jgi:hypothetical protein